MKYLLALAAGLPGFAAAQTTCTPTCAGTTSDGVAFDLSALMGKDFQTQSPDQSQTYYLNVCGVLGPQCPDDRGDPPVTNGTAIQTIGDGGCYVLGAYYGNNCLWTSNPGGNQGIELVLDNGSSDLCADGSPRQVTIDFLCPPNGSAGPLIPDSWQASNLPNSCEYTYTFETCAACKGGCAPPTPPPKPCCQPKPGFEHYEQLCNEQGYRGNCEGAFNTTCHWTCGDCIALPQFPQYDEFCSEHHNSTSCGEVNQTCVWKQFS